MNCKLRLHLSFLAAAAFLTCLTASSISMAAEKMAGDTKAIDIGNGVLLEMVWCPPGTFMMGSPNETNRSMMWSDEMQRSVTLTQGFWIGKYEVMQPQWEVVKENNPSFFKGENSPVEWVQWNDCQEFVRRLNEKTGLHFSLPTDVQWEYAYRAGCDEDLYSMWSAYKEPNAWGIYSKFT